MNQKKRTPIKAISMIRDVYLYLYLCMRVIYTFEPFILGLTLTAFTSHRIASCCLLCAFNHQLASFRFFFCLFICLTVFYMSRCKNTEKTTDHNTNNSFHRETKENEREYIQALINNNLCACTNVNICGKMIRDRNFDRYKFIN